MILRDRDRTVAITWLVWLSVIFGQPSVSSSVPSISTIVTEAHQRDVRDDQDLQQGQQVCMVLPNVTVLISFFFLPKVTKKYWFTRRNPVFRFLPHVYSYTTPRILGLQPWNQQKEWYSGPLFTSHTQHRIILYPRHKFTFKLFQGWRNKTCLSWVLLSRIWWETGQTHTVSAINNAPSDKKPPGIRLVLFLWTCIRLLSTGEKS